MLQMNIRVRTRFGCQACNEQQHTRFGRKLQASTRQMHSHTATLTQARYRIANFLTLSLSLSRPIHVDALSFTVQHLNDTSNSAAGSTMQHSTAQHTSHAQSIPDPARRPDRVERSIHRVRRMLRRTAALRSSHIACTRAVPVRR